MKKKYILVLTVLIASLTLSLTACGESDTDYSGSCEIFYKVGEQYENVEVSCASADISKENDTTYKVSLKSTAPVEVILSTTGYANKVYRYTTSQLKKGTITENVTFEKSSFAYKVKIMTHDDVNIEPEVKTEGITIKKVGEKEYELTSRLPIKSDVIITAKDYFDYTIPKSDIKYAMGNYGVMQGNITLLRKDSGKVMVSTNMSNYYQIDIIRASDNQNVGSVGYDNSIILDVDDYFFGFNSKVEFINRSNLENGYYYYKFNETRIILPDTYDYINDAMINGESASRGSIDSIYHRKPLEVGQMVKVVSYSNGEYTTFVGNITNEMVENAEIDLADLIVDTKQWQYDDVTCNIRFISKDGVVDMASGVVRVYNQNGMKEYGVNDDISINIKDYSVSMSDLVDKQGKKYEYYGNMLYEVREQSIYKGNNFTVDIFVKPTVEFTIRYVDLVGATLKEEKLAETVNTTYYLHVDGYKPRGSEEIIVSEKLNGQTITIPMVKTYNVTIRATGNVIDGTFVSPNMTNITFNNGEAYMTISENMLGTTLYFKQDFYQDRAYEFLLEIPNIITDEQTITVNIQPISDEWE